MFCYHCGKEILDEAVICPHCGCQVKNQKLASNNSSPAKTLAINGFILSFFIGLAGLTLSIVSLYKYESQTDQSCKGLATAGLIISIVRIFFVIILFATAY